MPGRRIVWVYSARPVTLSRASSRGSERPTWPPAVVVVAIAALLRRGLLGVGPERLGGVPDEGQVEDGLDRYGAVGLLGVSEKLPGALESLDVDIAVRIDSVRDDGAMHRRILDVGILDQDRDHL